MKIIDLFVKISKNEKVPKKIKYQSKIYEYNKVNNQYYETGRISEPDCALRNCLYDFRMLNDEIEIIEEDKKIKQLEFEEGEIEDKLFLARYITHNRAKIKELIDEVNKLKEGKK